MSGDISAEIIMKLGMSSLIAVQFYNNIDSVLSLWKKKKEKKIHSLSLFSIWQNYYTIVIVVYGLQACFVVDRYLVQAILMLSVWVERQAYQRSVQITSVP